jgi:2-polyprenyl-3-methyl-5-hydroxy-6-metoxy-1,4-benzoquinol methylase
VTKHDDREYWTRRHREGGKDVRVVGHSSWSPAENERWYARLATELRGLIVADCAAAERTSVLEIGYGLGHYARVCKELGFREYIGVDIATSAGPDLAPMRYDYQRRDVGARFALDRRFELVTAIDVLFHVTDEARFEIALSNIVRHAARHIYVTGLFHDAAPAAHVVHRRAERFAKLGELVDVRPWRDTFLARYRVRR